jgi:hypothetical protein
MKTDIFFYFLCAMKVKSQGISLLRPLEFLRVH